MQEHKKYSVVFILLLLSFLLVPVAHAALTDNLVNFYDADGASCVANRNVTGSNLTTHGGTTCIPQGKLGNAYPLNASNTIFFDGTNTNAPVATSARTLTFWFNVSNALIGYEHIVNYGADTADQAYGVYVDPLAG